MDWASVITGVFTVVGVVLTNLATRRSDREDTAATRSEAVRSQLQRIKSDLRGSDLDVALDAVVELHLLAKRVDNAKRYSVEDRDAVWLLMSSRVLKAVEDYPEDGTVELPPEGGA